MAELRRVFVPPERVLGRRVLLDAPLVRHLRAVLRLAPGDEFSATDGTGANYRARVEELGRAAGHAAILERTEPPCESSLTTLLAQAVPKGDRFELVLEKAVELGVSAVVPLLSRNTVRTPRSDATRWRRIVEGAVAQSGRTVLPQLHTPCSFEELIGGRPSAAVRILLWEKADTGMHTLLAGHAAPRSVLVAVGPEGGWSGEEAQQAQAAGFIAARLGPRILRAETAGIAAIAVIQNRWGDLG